MGVTNRRFQWLALLAGLLGVLMPAALLAQDDAVIVSIAMPEWIVNNQIDGVFDTFEAENPGIKVNVVKSGDEAFFVGSAYDVAAHLDGMQTYAGTADVVAVNGYNLSVEGTRAGYLLDLNPLTSIDPDLDVRDFFPAAWQSFQWDGGQWGMPVSMGALILAYKPGRFDEAGLAYPSELWTIDDFANAIRALTQRDENDEVTVPGFFTFSNTAALFRSLLGQGLYDSSTIPNPPALANPAVEALLTTWAELDAEGATGQNIDFSNFDFNSVPLRVDQSYILANFGIEDNAEKFEGALLPGGVAGLNVDGFAISAGTLYPDEAYELVKFLTTSPEMVNSFFSDSPARRSMVGAESENSFSPLDQLEDDDRVLIEQALEVALPLSELRFFEYLNQALNTMREEGVDALTALQEMEATASENLQTAADRRGSSTVAVATAVPTPVLAAGEVSLNFGMVSFVSPMPNREDWDTLIQEFASTDPQVRQIVMDTSFNTSLAGMSETFDCFYLPFNVVANTDDLSPVLALDPFIDADPSFDKSDVVGNTLALVQKNNQTYGFPVILQPMVLRYNSTVFADAGVPEPENGWTIQAFNDAVQLLKTDPEEPVFIPGDSGGTHLFVLIASYGGLPLDYRTTPVTANFTDPTTVDAIRQVLDLAKDGYLRYTELGSFGGGGFGGGFGDVTPIYTATLNPLMFYAFQPGSSEGENPYKLTTFPTGSTFSGVGYDIGTAYISSTTQNAEACYRWISTVAGRPDLFSGMPVHRSQINDPALATTQGEDVVATYQQLDALMSDPNTIGFPSQFGGIASPGDFIVQLWLYRAFDSYVLEGGDLDAELAEAQTFVEAYQGCVAGISSEVPGPEASLEEQQAYFEQFTDCAVNVDPSLSSLFNFGSEDDE